MDLQHLRYFCAIVAAGNMTRAAENVNISQPALSLSISKLESDLNVILFERLPRGIKLTPQGFSFLQFANEILQKEQEVRKKMDDLRTDVSGEINMRCRLITHLFAKAFIEFQKTYPNTEIRFLQTDADPAYDMLVTSEKINDPDLSSIILSTEEIFVAVPVNHRLSGHSTIRLQELANERFLSVDIREVEHIFQGYCASVGVTLSNVMKCSNTNILWSLLADGTGLSVVPLSWREKCTDKIRLVKIDDFDCTRNIILYWSKSRYMSNAALQFKEFLIHHFDRLMSASFHS